MTEPGFTVHSLRVRPVDVPLAEPIKTAGGVVTSAPLVVVDLLAANGVVGRGYIFTYSRVALGPTARLVENLAPLLLNAPIAPLALERTLQQQFRLLGPQGLTGMAMAAIDMAAWDALARLQQLPLVCLLGGQPRSISAYRSLGMNTPAVAAAQVEAAAAAGFRAAKIRLGYAELAADLAVLRAVRQAVGDQVQLLVDYNQALSVAEAIHRIRRLDEEGLVWVEEPTLADDAAGHARIAAAVSTPIQLGENWWGPHEMARSLEVGASDLAMLDVMKIGGVTGWQRAAALAEARGVPVSNHLFIELSAHLLAVTPTAHWMEYLDLAGPILREPIAVSNGQVQASSAPGAGLEWDEEALDRFAVG